MDYIIHYDVFSAILSFVMIIANVFMPFRNGRLRNLYVSMLAVVCFSCIFDIISSVMLATPNTSKGYFLVEYVATSLYYVVHILAPLLVNIYIYYCIVDRPLSKLIILYMSIPLCICVIAMMINPFTGIIFSIRNGVYQRGEWVMIYYIVAIVYMLASLFFYIAFHKKATPQIKVVVYSYLIITSSSVVIQYLFPRYLTECAAMTLVLIVIFFAIQSKDMVEEAIKNEAEQARLANLANQAKSNFLANMSHEIRTPINTMLGMNQMVIRESESLVIKKYAKNIENAGHTLLSLINDILDISKIESGNLSIQNDEYDVEAFIHGIIEEISPRCLDKKLSFVVEVDNMLPKKLYGDSMRLRQCAINLLTNAVKYTETGFVKLSVAYERINAKELMMKIFVIDSGKGIAEENIETITKRFNCFDSEKSKGIDGVGLGLSITEEVLEMMGSKMEIKSRVNSGSTFSFFVRQGIIDNTSVGNVNWLQNNNFIEELNESFISPKSKILVVDDNEMNLQVIRNLLRVNKVKIVTVESGAEAIKATRKIAFDLILMDYMMPHMDGKETMDTIKDDPGNLCRNTPVVVLTANAITGVKEQYLEEGFDEYLSKPIEYKLLENILVNLLPKDKIINKSF